MDADARAPCLRQQPSALIALVQTPDPARPLGPPLLYGFFPLEIKNHFDGISNRLPLKTLCLWRKQEMIYLCAPLLRAGYGREALAAFFDWLGAGDHHCSLMEFGFVTGEGPFHHLLLDYLNQHLKFTYVTEAFTRALFRPAADAEDYVRSALGASDEKSLGVWRSALRRRAGSNTRRSNRATTSTSGSRSFWSSRRRVGKAKGAARSIVARPIVSTSWRSPRRLSSRQVDDARATL